MTERETASLGQLVARVRESAKYRSAAPELIESIGARELARRGGLKDAIKATKKRLHQVTGAYLDSQNSLVSLTEELGPLPVAEHRLREACLRRMAQHRSTNERVPFLETFYATLLGDLPPIRSVLDVACAFHPLAIPWMPLASDVTYRACDVRTDLLDFLIHSFKALGVQGSAFVADVSHACPSDVVDVAFVLKLVPLLDRLDKGSAARLLDGLQATTTLVSFPTVKLGGKRVGMTDSYDARFKELARGKPWHVERFVFPTELVFRIHKLP